MISPRSLRTLMALLPLLALIAVTFSCERRPLEVHLDERVTVRIIADWDTNFVKLYGVRPNGMTLMLWGSNATVPTIRTTNDNYVVLKLEPDTYRVIIINELVEDYSPYISFADADDFGAIAQRAVRYGPISGQQPAYMYTPEDPRIAVAADTFLVTPEMVLQDTAMFVRYEDYKRNGYDYYSDRERIYEIYETPWPMTVDFYVQLKFRNRHSIRTVNGSISGLADGFYLSRIVRTTEPGTVKFDPQAWNRNKFGDEDDNLGVITTRLASFGMPYGKELIEERDSADNILDMDIELVNDSVIHRTFKVGKYIRYITPEGEEARIRYRQDLQNLQLVIELPDTIQVPFLIPPGGAGFDAWVDEWEDGGTFSIGGF